MTTRRAHTSTPTDGSRTLLLCDTPRRDAHDDAHDDDDGSATPNPTVGVLKLRGAQRRTRQRVAWDADVVDNEGCGRKKSKVCCIYHKPRRFDESSSDSDSDSGADSDADSDSDVDAGEGGARRYGDDRARPTRRCRHAHGGAVQRGGQGGGAQERHVSDSDSEVNAYERVPTRKS